MNFIKMVTGVLSGALISLNLQAGTITVSGTGLIGTDRTENFETGVLGTNSSFSNNGLNISTLSGFGVTMTSYSNCGNSGISGNYLYAGLGGLCFGNTTADAFSISFDDDISELSWSGFSRASGAGFTIEALLDNVVVSSIVFDNNNRFERQFVTFSGSNFDEIRVTENATDGVFFAMDDFAWNLADSSSVPTPGSIALLGLGLAGVGYSRRKKA